MLSIDSPLGEIKKEFTRVTRLPAKKSFAAVVAKIGNRKMQSKTDWLWVLDNIEMVLVPIAERTEQRQEDQPEIPEVEQAQSSPDAEMTELCSVALQSEEPEQVFVEAFATAEDAKTLYRRLAKISHPDRGGSDRLFQILNSAYSEYQQNTTYYQEAYATRTGQSATDFSGSTLSDKELREWLS